MKMQRRHLSLTAINPKLFSVGYSGGYFDQAQRSTLEGSANVRDVHKLGIRLCQVVQVAVDVFNSVVLVESHPMSCGIVATIR